MKRSAICLLFCLLMLLSMVACDTLNINIQGNNINGNVQGNANNNVDNGGSTGTTTATPGTTTATPGTTTATPGTTTATPGTTTATPGTTTATPSGPNDPNGDKPQSSAVFSNGVVPSIPTVDADTKNAVLSSSYGVIIDVESGKIIAGKNANTQFEPASMTKVMALIVACEKLTQEDLQKQITYTEYYANYKYEGLALGIASKNSIGDRFSIEGLLYGIGVMSAGDCTLMIAEYTYGTMDAFVAAMNQKVGELGLTKTHFVNASGNDDIEGNVTTAVEMAVIMQYAMQSPLICDILSVDYYRCQVEYTDDDGIVKTYGQPFASTLFEYDGCTDKNNRMYRYKTERGKAFELETVDGLMGKTGYLDDPHRSYLVCAGTGKTSGNRYIVVVGECGRFVSTMDDIKLLFDTYAK